MQSSSEQPLVGEERYVTTLITTAKETTFYYEVLQKYCRVKTSQWGGDRGEPGRIEGAQN